MRFNEALSKLQYSIKSQDKNYISIVFEDKPSSIIILFDLKNKLIDGMLTPNEGIRDINQMSHQYALYNKMQDDLKTFAELSKYRRI